MRILQHASIKRKLLFTTMVISTVALILVSLVYATYDMISFRRAMIRNLSTLAHIIGTNSTAALEFEDRTTAEEILIALKAEPHIVASVLYTTQGQLFAQYLRDTTPKTLSLPPVQDKTHWFDLSHLFLFRPVLRGRPEDRKPFISSQT